MAKRKKKVAKLPEHVRRMVALAREIPVQIARLDRELGLSGHSAELPARLGM